MVLTDEPVLLIGSPMCTIHSVMNNINHARMPTEVVRQRFEHARRHLEFATKLYKIQAQEGRYFLHEHLESVSSWQERCVQEVLNIKGVKKVMGDQCRYGLTAKGNNGPGPARKATGFMTNSPCIALQLKRRCPNRGDIRYTSMCSCKGEKPRRHKDTHQSCAELLAEV